MSININDHLKRSKGHNQMHQRSKDSENFDPPTLQFRRRNRRLLVFVGNVSHQNVRRKHGLLSK